MQTRIPDNISAMLLELDKARGFPPGLMQSILMQEVSGKEAYLNNPGKYHYAPDKTGRRKSTARGPFGILADTARQPGYGVKPLKSWDDFNEHARFAADYLKARINTFGGLAEGVKMYGTGEDRYAADVLRRIGQFPEPANPGMKKQPMQALSNMVPQKQLAQQDAIQPVDLTQVDQVARHTPEVPPVPNAPVANSAWDQFNQAYRQAPAENQAVTPQALNYGKGIANADFSGIIQQGLASMGQRAKDLAMHSLLGFQEWGR